MSAVGPTSPEPSPQKAEATHPELQKPPSSGGSGHVWGNMTFTPKQWQMFMKNLEQNISLEIKKENDQWKRENRRMRRMWSGG
ncbi:MAG: hypothetical protein SNF33_05330 [Candidatus Algichlamydia australiensis]|nr:hypothetical protein [Chlamydiales bacterium]